jgi:hypothetical protein
MMDAALTLAARFRVLPLWPILPATHTGGFICGCGKANCSSPGKHPLPALAPNGVKNATRDHKLIEHWWTARPDANIAIATGDGVVVLDIDPRHGGDESIVALQKTHGRLPQTLTAHTGGGGWHVYFAGGIANSVGALGAGLDVRGAGGFVVAPPSLHVSGKHYEWRGFDVPIAPAPDWLVEELGKHKAGAAPERWSSLAGSDVREGKRNATITSLTGKLLRHYVDATLVLDLVRCWNACRCQPPLTDDELAIIFNSVCGREQKRREAQ